MVKYSWLFYVIIAVSHIVTITVSHPAFTNQTGWNYATLLIVASMALLSLTAKWYADVAASRELKRIFLQDLLHKAHRTVLAQQGRTSFKTLRANIMHLNRGQQTIIAHVGMDYSADRNIVFNEGQGCCGAAARDQEPFVAKLEELGYNTSYENLIDPETRTARWGITGEQWEITRDLKSLLSIPIFDSRYSERVIGVLNFDDKIPFAASKFDEGELWLTLLEDARVMSRWMESLGFK